ncbi:MAG: phosphate ABC transporter permease subunit PstC [Deltaproteobacteria bacterium]|nr:phosphate ABC transporter permease subunit PstC [Deltaproteobacteria bacterium]
MSNTYLKERRSESVFKALLLLSSFIIIILLFSITLTLIIESYPSIKHNGLSLLTGDIWDPVSEKYSILPFIVGTFLTSILALIISTPFSLAASLYLGEYAEGKRSSRLIKAVLDLLAGIPSIIYGFWGLMVLVPVVRKFEELIGIPPLGIGIFTASLILSIMIIPYTTSIAREVIKLVPQDIKEAAYSLGATRFEVIRDIIIPYAKSGIFAGILLSFGRAFGETMAVTMVIGNANYIPKSIFAPANTMASVIANEFAEATSDLYISTLISLGLVLLIMSLIVNSIGRFVIMKLYVK